MSAVTVSAEQNYAPQHTRSRLVVVCLLATAFLIGLGNLSVRAWLDRPTPTNLPEVGARTNEAEPLLFIVIDGLREAAAWTTENPPMPWLQSFAEEGTWGTAITGEPTLTAACVRCLISGRRPDLITGFQNFDAPPAPGTFIEYLVKRGAKAAHGGDAAMYQMCRDYYKNGAVFQVPDRGPVDQGESDLRAVPFVLARIEEGHDLVTVHLTFPDHAGHKHGATGEAYRYACATVDAQIKSVVTAFRTAHKRATVCIASDHGVSDMGTHGGGEWSARRAPFCIVGPGIRRQAKVETDQSSIAPTIAAALGLPQPPLADGPPEVTWLKVPTTAQRAILRDYLEARTLVANDVSGVTVDFVERRRALRAVQNAEAVDRDQLQALIADVDQLVNPRRHVPVMLALLAAFLGLLTLLRTHQRTTPLSTTRGWIIGIACAAVSLLLVGATPGVSIANPWVVACLLGVALVLAWTMTETSQGGPSLATGVAGALLTIPIVTSAGQTLQAAYERFSVQSRHPASLMLAGVVALVLAIYLVVTIRKRRSNQAATQSSFVRPVLLAALGGALLGALLTLRPFVDNLIATKDLIAILAIAAIVQIARRAHGDSRRRAFFAGLACVLLVIPRIADRALGDNWMNAVPIRDMIWLAAGILVSLGVLAIAWTRRIPRTLGGLAIVCLVLAFGFRCVDDVQRLAWFGRGGAITLALASTLLPLLLLVLSTRCDDPKARWWLQLVAALALARRLSAKDAEFLMYACAAGVAQVASAFQFRMVRVSLAWLALAIILLRTALFHAMGFVESFSTLDVGQAFAGLGTGDAPPTDAAAGVTWQIVVAGIQVALRMGLPWLLFVGVLLRMSANSSSSQFANARTVLADIVVGLAGRGAFIVWALWVWWRNAWWTGHAHTVYAYAAADVLLLSAAALLVGVLRSDQASSDSEVSSSASPA